MTFSRKIIKIAIHFLVRVFKNAVHYSCYPIIISLYMHENTHTLANLMSL